MADSTDLDHVLFIYSEDKEDYFARLTAVVVNLDVQPHELQQTSSGSWLATGLTVIAKSIYVLIYNASLLFLSQPQFLSILIDQALNATSKLHIHNFLARCLVDRALQIKPMHILSKQANNNTASCTCGKMSLCSLVN